MSECIREGYCLHKINYSNVLPSPSLMQNCFSSRENSVAQKIDRVFQWKTQTEEICLQVGPERHWPDYGLNKMKLATDMEF